MTKAKIIETIQNLESELWLEYNRYSYYNAPQGEGYPAVVDWQSEDPFAKRMRTRWAVIHDLMEQIGVAPADNEANQEALEYSQGIFRNAKETA